MPGEGFRCLENFKALCVERGVPLPEIVEYAEIFWIYSFVVANKGLGFCLPHLAKLESFSQSENIVVIPLKELKWTVCCTWVKAHELKPIEVDFLNHVQKRAKKLKRLFS